MPRRRISENVRWQIIGMHVAGMSCRNIGVNFDINHTVISRLARKHADTGHVKDRQRQGRPRKTTARDDRAFVRLARPMATAPFLPLHWGAGVRVSNSTFRRRLRAAGLKTRQPIRRPFSTDRLNQAHLEWCGARRNWNLRTWRGIHWSEESRFLQHMTVGRLRVRRRPNEAYNQLMIYATEPFGGGSVMVWGCFSYDCKLDLITIPRTFNAQRYQQEMLDAAVIPHFDNHPLVTHPIFMEDNVRPHRGRAVIAHAKQRHRDLTMASKES